MKHVNIIRSTIFAAAALLAAGGAWADTWTDPDTGYTWTYRISGDTAEIYGYEDDFGLYPAISPEPTGAVMIPSALGGKPVTSIGDYAFYQCSGLTSVTIPNSVTDIRSYAFSGCSGLTSVTIGNGVTYLYESAFYGCSGLTSVTIPDSVTHIDDRAFGRCSGLTSVTIGNGVTWLGPSAFYGCSELLFDTTTVPGVKLVDGWAVGTTESLPSTLNLTGVRGIGKSVFSGCSGLTSVTIPDSVTSIGEFAFDGCSGLASVTIGNGVTCIWHGAFGGCGGLTSLTIGNGVTRILSRAFEGCSGLTNVMIPDSLTYMGSYVFDGCRESLFDKTTVPGVKLIDGWAVGTTESLPGTLNLTGVRGIGGSAFENCSGLTSVTIPGSVTSIGDDAFRDCNGLTGVMIPDSVTSIEDGAFQGCSGLTSVTIGKGVTSIGWCAFYECSGLTSVTIPGSVTSIGWCAFKYDYNLSNVTFLGNAPIIEEDAFKKVSSDCMVYVLRNSTGWGVDIPGTWNGMKIEYASDSNAEPTPTPTPEPGVGHALFEEIQGSAPAVAAGEYNGYLYDANSGAVKGTIQVKVGKPGKDGAASVKATVQLGAKKATLKAADNGKTAINSDGPTVVVLVGGESCTVTLGSNSISGTYGAYLIDGARNFFASKSGGEAANAVLGKWLGVVSVVWDGGSVGVGIAAKGKVKVSGTLASGTKVSASSAFLVGEEWCCVPVVAPKANLAFTLWLSRDGRTAVVEGLGDGAIAGKPGALAANAAFHVSKTAALWSSISGAVLTDYLPDGVKVTSSGGKWFLPKAGKVVYTNGAVDESKLGENPSGLKLTYKSKDGSFKGSFKVYAVDGGKAKATTVNVAGVMVGTTGYGTATIKGKGGVAVTIE